MMNRRQKFGLVFAMCLVASAAVADSLELNNGSLIKGKFVGGNQNSINFQVGSSMQSYSVGDIRALRFDSEPEGAGVSVPSEESYGSVSAKEAERPSSYVTIPAGTRISVRTIDASCQRQSTGRNGFSGRQSTNMMADSMSRSLLVAGGSPWP